MSEDKFETAAREETACQDVELVDHPSFYAGYLAGAHWADEVKTYECMQPLISGLKKLLQPHEFDYFHKVIMHRALNHPDALEILGTPDSAQESK